MDAVEQRREQNTNAHQTTNRIKKDERLLEEKTVPLFGSPKFFEECKNAINKNEGYADSAHDWETSFLFVVELDEETKEAFKNLTKMAEDNEEVKRIIKNMGEGYGFNEGDLKKGKIDELAVYLDLWHGKCREIKT
ncbi:hypothetical protein AKJ45_03780, partial [candidate division MSBL1 archaeon SCGC-AAA261F19]